MVDSLGGQTTDRLRYEVDRDCHLLYSSPIRRPRQFEVVLILGLLGRCLVLSLLHRHRDHDRVVFHLQILGGATGFLSRRIVRFSKSPKPPILTTDSSCGKQSYLQ